MESQRSSNNANLRGQVRHFHPLKCLAKTRLMARMNILTSEPKQFTSGDTVSWRTTLDNYSADDGWQLHYVLINAAQKISLAATASGKDHLISLPANITTAFGAGEYQWQSYVTKTVERYTVSSGLITILQGFSDLSAGFDARSHVKKTLDAIESWLENKNPAVAEYEIAGRRMRYIPMTDLLKMRNLYKQELASENVTKGIDIGGRGRLQVRF